MSYVDIKALLTPSVDRLALLDICVTLVFYRVRLKCK